MYQERIRTLYDQFSPGYRRIADYVLEHYQDAAFMTANVAQVFLTDEAWTATLSGIRSALRVGGVLAPGARPVIAPATTPPTAARPDPKKGPEAFDGPGVKPSFEKVE